jgi:hypothetical protein
LLKCKVYSLHLKNFKSNSLRLFVPCCFLPIFSFPVALSAVDFYVSPRGSEQADGRLGHPYSLVRVQSAARPYLLTSTIQVSMESHLMGFKAEESRLQHGKLQEIAL